MAHACRSPSCVAGSFGHEFIVFGLGSSQTKQNATYIICSLVELGEATWHKKAFKTGQPSDEFRRAMNSVKPIGSGMDGRQNMATARGGRGSTS